MFLELYCKVKAFGDRQEGSNMMEYIVIGAIVAIALVAVMGNMSGALTERFECMIEAIRGNTPQGTGC
jgi:Flp pilus assembly pilin Flp